MSLEWITDAQNSIATIVKTRSKKKLVTKFPNIYYTTDEESSIESNFPTVFIHFLPSAELVPTLEGTEVSAFLCGCQVTVICNKEQGQLGCQKVMNCVLDEFKRLGFQIQLFPELNLTGNNTKQLIARVKRNVCSRDIL